MRNAFGWIWSSIVGVLGLAVFIAVMLAIARTHTVMWRRVSARYPRRGTAPSGSTKLETIVIAQRGVLQPFSPQSRQYAGTLLSVSDRGLTLTLIPIPPLNLMAPALFLPFDEMSLDRTGWALWPDPFAVRMRSLPDTDIIIGRETAAWIRKNTERPPFGFGD